MRPGTRIEEGEGARTDRASFGGTDTVMKSIKWIAALSFVGVVGAGMATASPASACGDGLWEPPAPEEVTVGAAEVALESGDEAQAAEDLNARFWYLRGALPHAGTVPVIQRAIRALALAAVRKDGAVRVGAPYSYGSAIARKENVAWGISRLRMLDKAFPDSYTGKSDLGEALSRGDATREEGKTMLESLFASDKLVGRQAMNQLTRLRAQGGDADGAKLVAARCTKSYGTTACESPVEGSQTVASK